MFTELFSSSLASPLTFNILDFDILTQKNDLSKYLVNSNLFPRPPAKWQKKYSSYIFYPVLDNKPTFPTMKPPAASKNTGCRITANLTTHFIFHISSEYILSRTCSLYIKQDVTLPMVERQLQRW